MALLGVGYLLGGLLGMSLNLIVAVVLLRDREISGATRQFMAHLALSDMECFLGGAVYPSIIMLIKPESESSALVRLFSFLHDSGWHTSITFMALLAFSRLVYFAKKNKMELFFGRTSLPAIIFGAWILIHATISPLLFYTPIALNHDPQNGKRDFWWSENNTMAEGLMLFQAVHTSFALVVQVLCNAGAMYYIFRMRNQIMVAEVRSDFRREVKIFLQCLIDTSVFVFMYLGVNIGHHLEMKSKIYWSFFDAMWFLNHGDCALLYLCLNPRLRNALFGLVKKTFSGQSATTNVVEPILPISAIPMHHRHSVVVTKAVAAAGVSIKHNAVIEAGQPGLVDYGGKNVEDGLQI